MSDTRRTTSTAAALALYAEYREHRAEHRPFECNSGTVCWVRDGPPSITRRGPASHCAGCGGRPSKRGRSFAEAAE